MFVFLFIQGNYYQLGIGFSNIFPYIFFYQGHNGSDEFNAEEAHPGWRHEEQYTNYYYRNRKAIGDT